MMSNRLCEYDKLFHTSGIVSVFLAQSPVSKNLNTLNISENILLFIGAVWVTGSIMPLGKAAVPFISPLELHLRAHPFPRGSASGLLLAIYQL